MSVLNALKFVIIKIDPERMQSDLEQRLAKLRHEISTSELAALIITPFDERQNLYLEESPEHLQWLTGHVGYAVVSGFECNLMWFAIGTRMSFR